MPHTLLSRQFQMFAQQECQGSSPLYEHLANKIAEDEDLLDIASLIPQGQPAPNLLLAAVHYLVAISNDPLTNYYASLTPFRIQYRRCSLFLKHLYCHIQMN